MSVFVQSGGGGGGRGPADTLSLIISEHSLQTFIDQPQLHQSSALPFQLLGLPARRRWANITYSCPNEGISSREIWEFICQIDVGASPKFSPF